MPETEKGRLTFIDERNAWFCTDPATAWGDDWNDAPHDCNAGCRISTVAAVVSGDVRPRQP